MRLAKAETNRVLLGQVPGLASVLTDLLSDPDSHVKSNVALTISMLARHPGNQPLLRQERNLESKLTELQSSSDNFVLVTASLALNNLHRRL